jgi:hypothetical protein
MEAILESFDISPVDKFNDMLIELRAVVAGSAPLAALVGGFTPNDIDIWVCPYSSYVAIRDRSNDFKMRGIEYNSTAFELYHKYGKTTNFVRPYIKEVLSEFGYECDLTIGDNNNKKYIHTASITEAYSKAEVGKESDTYDYIDPDDIKYGSLTHTGLVISIFDRYYLKTDTEHTGKSIKVITTRRPIVNIVKEFDLSVCRTWWNGELLLGSNDLDLTICRIMYQIREPRTENEKKRIQKYKERRFTIIPRSLVIKSCA